MCTQFPAPAESCATKHPAADDTLVNDLIATVEDRLRQHQIGRLDDVRAFGKPLAGFSDELDRQRLELKAFLMEHMYRHYRVMRMAVKAQRVMAELFASYMSEPTQLPPHILARHRNGQETLARVVADYIAGMTDRFAWKDPSGRPFPSMTTIEDQPDLSDQTGTSNT